jgi:Sulfotransferase domain
VTEPRLPNLVIAGVGKAGTTSLFWYLSQHPDICASSVKEPRYFRLPDDATELPPLEGYAQHFAHCGSQRYVMEASPQYFKGGPRTIALMKQVLGEPRVILMFREPADRMWSEYRFKKARMSFPASLTFEDYVAACERVRDAHEPRNRENELYYTLAGGPYIDNVVPWLDAFGPDLMVGFFERMASDPPSFVAEVCGWLDIDAGAVRSFNYSVENKSVQYRNPTLQRLAMSLNAERLLRNRRRLKGPLRRLYYSVNRARGSERMAPETRRRLNELFAPSNARLAEELKARGYAGLPDWLTGVGSGTPGAATP